MNITCLTQDCLTASENILQNLHPNYRSIDPCTNFDQYVCGGFPLRYSDMSHGPTTQIETQRHVQIFRQLLDGELAVTNPSADDTKIFDKLKANYKACMDGEMIRREEHSGFKNVFDRLKALFPVSASIFTSSALMSPADYDRLVDLLVYTSGLGTDVLIAYDFDKMNNEPRIILPSIRPAVSAPILAQRNPKSFDRALDFLPARDRQQLLKDVFKLDSALSTIVVGDLHHSPIAKAKSKIPALAIDEVLLKLLPKEYQLGDVLVDDSALEKVNNLLVTTPKVAIQAYVFIKVGLLIETIFLGSSESDRWNLCHQHIAATMPHAANKMFVDGASDKNQKPAVMGLFDDLKTTYVDRMDHVEWMTDAVKAAAKDKLRNMNATFFLPQEFPNAPNGTELLAYYADLKIGPSHYSNTLSWTKWWSKHRWDKLIQPRHYEFQRPTYIVNSEYVVDHNYVNLYAGAALPPFFGTGLPQYLNYGGLGMIISHEMTHGFDNRGWTYDGNGDLSKTPWDDETVAAYQARQRCLVDQFDHYVMHEDQPKAGVEVEDPKSHQKVHVNGTLTLTENIADNGAIANAYAAWKRHNALEPYENPLLPRLGHFTPEQLFFVAAGQFFCHNSRLIDFLWFMPMDTHSPNEARIRGIMDNSMDFKAAFKCAEQSQPVCRVW